MTTRNRWATRAEEVVYRAGWCNPDEPRDICFTLFELSQLEKLEPVIRRRKEIQ